MDHVPLRPGNTLADLAQACGYYDQAHFVREIRAVAGVTPGAFVRGCSASIPLDENGMSCSYNTARPTGASLRCHGTQRR